MTDDFKQWIQVHAVVPRFWCCSRVVTRNHCLKTYHYNYDNEQVICIDYLLSSNVQMVPLLRPHVYRKFRFQGTF